jgi:hypothetical protein
VAPGASYEVELPSIVLNSPACPALRGGARRHPHAVTQIHGKAAERLHGFLRISMTPNSH